MGNIKLTISFVGLNALDAALTQAAIVEAAGYEGMPIMKAIIGHSWGAFWAFKIGIAVGVVALLLRFQNKFPGVVHRLFVGLVVGFGAVCAWNVVVLL